MGWGVDLIWSDLQKAGCRLGIVDAVSLRHLAPAAQGYEVGPEADRLRAMMKARGIKSLHAFQRTLGAWRIWQKDPPWRVHDVTLCEPLRRAASRAELASWIDLTARAVASRYARPQTWSGSKWLPSAHSFQAFTNTSRSSP